MGKASLELELYAQQIYTCKTYWDCIAALLPGETGKENESAKHVVVCSQMTSLGEWDLLQVYRLDRLNEGKG